MSKELETKLGFLAAFSTVVGVVIGSGVLFKHKRYIQLPMEHQR